MTIINPLDVKASLSRRQQRHLKMLKAEIKYSFSGFYIVLELLTAAEYYILVALK